MDTVINRTLHHALHGTKLDRRNLLVKLLACFPPEELGSVTTMVKHRRRKVLKNGDGRLLSIPSVEDADVSLPVVPLPNVPLPTVPMPASTTLSEFWFTKYGADQDPNKILAFDVEMVGVPYATYPLETVRENDGKYVKFQAVDPALRLMKKKVDHNMVAAKVSVVNFDGQTIYKATVKHEKDTYVVNAHTIGINGIQHDDLENGKDINIVRSRLQALFSGSLIVTHAGVHDFGSLDMEPGEYVKDNFELQQYWKRKDGSGFKLKDVYHHYFKNTNFQVGVHDDEKDALATMRLFRFQYLKEKKLDTKYPNFKYEESYCDSDFVRKTSDYDDDDWEL